MADQKINIDLDAANPMAAPDVPQMQAVEKDVVFVAYKDIQLTVNQETLTFTARAPKKVTRDQARILQDADAGYVMQ